MVKWNGIFYPWILLQYFFLLPFLGIGIGAISLTIICYRTFWLEKEIYVVHQR